MRVILEIKKVMFQWMLNPSYVNEGLYLLTHFPDSSLLLCYINMKLIKLLKGHSKFCFWSLSQ